MPQNRKASKSHALIHASACDIADGLSNTSMIGVPVPGLCEVEAEIDALHCHHLALPRVVGICLEAVVERRSALITVEDIGLAHVALEHDSAFEILTPRVNVLAVACHHAMRAVSSCHGYVAGSPMCCSVGDAVQVLTCGILVEPCHH